MDRELFEQVFSDAHLVDFDLSVWDKAVSVYVLADHLPRSPDGRLPLYKVVFETPSEMHLDFRHLSGPDLSDGEHVQWQIARYELHECDAAVEIKLWGFSRSPVLTLSCSNVLFQEIDLALVDRAFPRWDRPCAGLIRPSIEMTQKPRR